MLHSKHQRLQRLQQIFHIVSQPRTGFVHRLQIGYFVQALSALFVRVKLGKKLRQ